MVTAWLCLGDEMNWLGLGEDPGLFQNKYVCYVT